MKENNKSKCSCRFACYFFDRLWSKM